MTYHRTSKGGLRRLPDVTELSKLRRLSVKIGIPLLSICISTGAVWFRSDVCASAMLFVTMFVIQSRPDAKTNSLRRLILSAAVLEMAILLYIGHTAACFLWAKDNNETMDVDSSITDHFRLGSRAQWIYVLFQAVPLSRLIATTLRFDFSNYVQAAQSQPTIVVEAAPALPATTGGQLPAGTIAPSYTDILRVPFKRHYFSATVLAWLLANAVVYALNTAGALPDMVHIDYALYVLVMSIPFIITALFTVAWARGEVKQMWKYEEVWTVKPAAADALDVAAVPVVTEAAAVDYEKAAKKSDSLCDV
ncbi:hypothetical protein FIBSPDRAFT_362011 [Athelia psychrophila]|uniref:Uncharacterized protein n=1 Tax=Athelia psychrophila TaxID=1759441 RepID=A0A166PC47_9AGAM|nr:hypothetical protein FIBSPDRAFT_362011 [Fibularhizoctonia sp. CBS 109695]